MFDADSKLMLETLNRLMMDIAGGQSDSGMIDRAFRAAHSIKSEAGVLGLDSVAEAAHALENTLSEIRSSDGTSSYHSRLRTELSHLTGEIEHFRSRNPASGTEGEVRSVPTDTTLGPPELGMLREARARNETLYRVAVRVNCDPEFVYPRAFLVVNNLEISCSVVQVTPALEQLQSSGDGRLAILLTTPGNEDVVRKATSVDEVELLEVVRLSFDEIASVSEPPASPVYEAAGTVLSVDARSQEEILLLADEVSDIASKLRSRLPSLGLGEDEVAAVNRLAGYSQVLRSRVDRTSRVQLLDMVRSLKAWAASHAEAAGKKVRLVAGGNGAVVYTVVADTIADALLHLVRNSIDHGIELPSERASRGKNAEGTIKVTVEHLGESIRIRVTDDGAGIDEAAVREQSGDRDSPLLDIIAAPGFTQRAAADRSSGRGVGLDIVVHTVRDLMSGGIDIRSQLGRGTIVSMSVPLTSRLVHVLIVESTDGPAAVPASMIVEHRGLNLKRYKRDSFGGRYYDFHGQSLPLLTLFGKDPADDSLSGDTVGIVVRAGARNAVLAASRVIASEAVVRDEIQRRQVYSRVLGRGVPYLFPPSFTVLG